MGKDNIERDKGKKKETGTRVIFLHLESRKKTKKAGIRPKRRMIGRIWREECFNTVERPGVSVSFGPTLRTYTPVER